MAKNLNVMGTEISLTTVQAAKMYAVVMVRPAPLRTDAGTYVAYDRVAGTSDDYARAVALLKVSEPGPGALKFVVRVEDSAVIL